MKKVKCILIKCGERLFAFSPFALTVVFCVTMVCCSGRRVKSAARETAQKSVVFTVNDERLNITAVGMADSVIDGKLFSPRDQEFLMKVMSSASQNIFDALYEEEDPDSLVAKFDSMTASSFDTSVLAQEMMMQSLRKSDKSSGQLTGWRVKVDYEAPAPNGKITKFERWCYLDPSGTSVVKSFDIPVTW